MAKTSKKNTAASPTTRPPVVVVLGHVDHGKTTLLDTIRQTSIAASEHGGITQGIGAYQVALDQDRKITFIDTPGHEAFSQMRSFGTKVADIAILVVAANDSVMPQTIESIQIIKEANIPFIVAINKIDLPDANVDKVTQDLLRYEVMLESFGGQIPMVKVSAKQNQGITELLELIDLLAKMTGLSGNAENPLKGTIIESRLDKGRGAVATAIIQDGTIKVAQPVFINGQLVKVRALIDYTGAHISEATCGMPVEILGLAQVPTIGAKLQGELPDTTGDVALIKTRAHGSSKEDSESLKLILRADTVGSLDAIMAKIPDNVTTLSSEVGEITDADVLLAKSTKAIILGFATKIRPTALKLAEADRVLVRTYKIIYELLSELDDAAAGMLEPITTEEILGVGQIIAEFPFDKTKIAGTKVMDGRLARGDQARITRHDAQNESGEIIVGLARIKALRVQKDESNKVEKGKECGVLLDSEVDFRPGDAIICYRIV